MAFDRNKYKASRINSKTGETIDCEIDSKISINKKPKAKTKANCFKVVKKLDLDLGKLYYEVSHQHRKAWKELFKKETTKDWNFANIEKLSLSSKINFHRQWKKKIKEFGISNPIIDKKIKSLRMSDDEFDEINKSSIIKHTDKLKFPPTVLSVQDKIWGTIGGISIIMGPAKSRKTFLVIIAVVAVLCTKTIIGKIIGTLPEVKKRVLYFDTEQAEYNVIKVARKIAAMVNNEEVLEDNLEISKIRGLNTEQRLAFIDKKIMEKSNYIGLVIIDGIRDLLVDINSPQQATKISDYLLKWAEIKNIHVIGVLHSNKTDNNLRGHIGTEMLNKAETVLSVEKLKTDKEISVVKCREGRHIDFEDFAFKINEDGLPVEVELIPVEKVNNSSYKKFESHEDKVHKAVLVKVFSRNPKQKLNDLKTTLSQEWGKKQTPIGLNVIDKWIKVYLNEKVWLKMTITGKAHIYELADIIDNLDNS